MRASDVLGRLGAVRAWLFPCLLFPTRRVRGATLDWDLLAGTLAALSVLQNFGGPGNRNNDFSPTADLHHACRPNPTRNTLFYLVVRIFL